MVEYLLAHHRDRLPYAHQEVYSFFRLASLLCPDWRICPENSLPLYTLSPWFLLVRELVLVWGRLCGIRTTAVTHIYNVYNEVSCYKDTKKDNKVKCFAL